jgi:hypothetical protein
MRSFSPFATKAAIAAVAPLVLHQQQQQQQQRLPLLLSLD